MIATVKQPDEIDKQIIRLCREGKTSKQIGYEMNLSPYTVSNRVKEMLRYYKCSNRLELVIKLTESNFQ